ncbi:hypothetical protein ACFOOK_08505 [Micromonospora krabiensis]|uniref:Uncharacterized protein n=1 Tax=Micromonospora krabiensis TaxID=307121 RepID=A0A1C3NBP2_9ACTN|nr:hypothetical protein [Micromonospora krabiensis]SBV29961.1 hypothetical protein GA0070620_5548 [Micromonospora krabiensis]
MRQEEQHASNDHREAVRSAPVPVPNGDRAGRADVPEDALDDRGTFDDPAVTGERADAERDDDARITRTAERDADEGGFHEPAPLPSALGAPSVGGAVAASALASPRPEDEPDPREEWTARPGDGAEEGPREGLRADPTAELHDGDRGTASADRGGAVDAAAYGSAAPRMVDPDAAAPDADPALAGAAGAGAAGAPGSLTAAGTSRPAGSTVAAEPASLFDADTAQSFRDRWRDVQLRFVDDPRAAAAEAQAMVEEAIEALSAALTAQRNTLGAWQEAGAADTEELRMAVRRYRDFLDRVLGR